jgi:hypothetical protein
MSTTLAPLGTRSASWLLLACSALCACKKPPPPDADVVPSASVAPPPSDRLAPGELSAGDGNVFGLPVPREMQVALRAPDSALVVGEVEPEALRNYVKERVVVGFVEVRPDRTVFPTARIKDGPPDRVFDIEIGRDQKLTKLHIRDTTPVAPPPGLSDAERWRRAGFTPDGKPLNLKQLE